MSIFRIIKKSKRVLKSALVILLVLSNLLAGFPVDYILGKVEDVLADRKVVDALYWATKDDKVVDKMANLDLPRALGEAQAAVNSNGLFTYSDTADTDNMNARTYTHTTTLGGEYTTINTSDTNNITHLKVLRSPTRDEAIAVHQKDTGIMDIMYCTGGCDATGDWTHIATYSTITSDANSENMRAFDIAYEQLSGRFMVAHAVNGDTGDIYYCLWDGTNWSPSTECNNGGARPATFSPGAGNQIDLEATMGTNAQPEWIRLVPRGERLTSYRTNEIMLGVSDAGDDLFLARWTGSTWTDQANPLDDMSAQNAQKFDIAWEETTGHALAVVTDDGVANLRYVIYDGADWGSLQTSGEANNGGQAFNRWVNLANDPMTDDIAMVINDSGNDTELFFWDGSSLDDQDATDDVSAESTVGNHSQVQWSRFTSRAVIIYTDSNALTSDMQCWETGGGNFTAVVSDIGNPNISNGDDIDDAVLVASPNNDRMILTRRGADTNSTTGDDIDALTYDGTGCADNDWVSVGQLTGSGEGANTVNTTPNNSISRVHWSAYTPYSPWSRNWRFFDDETSDDPSTGLNGAAENTAPTDVDPEEIIRLRINVSENSGMGQTDTRKILQYTSGCTPNSAGGESGCTWTNVGDTTATTDVWRYATSGESCSNCTDGATSTTARLTGTNDNVIYISDSDAAADTDFDHTALSVKELDFPLKAEAVSSGTTYYFRVYEPRISSNGQDSAVFREQDDDGNNDCASATCTYPSLTITAGTPDADQIHYRWRNDDGAEGSGGGSWLSSNWTYRKEITIDADEVSGSGDLSNFPVLISITDNDLRTTGNGGEVVQSDGGDIAFTNSSGTQLDHEIESYNASTGALVAWVEVPTLSGSTDTDIYIYYGNSVDGGNQWDINGTWDGAGYGAVWHLAEDPSTSSDGYCGGGTDEGCDSTVNANHYDSGGSMTNGDLISARIGNGLDFDGSNDYLDAGSDVVDSGNDFSVSVWARTSDSGFALLFDERDSDFIGTVLEIGFEGAGIPAFVVEGDTNATKAIGPSNIADNQWYHLVGVWNEATQTASLYINGSLADTDSATVGNSEVNDQFGISIQSGGTSGGFEGGAAFQGVLDEARTIPSVLTADWIATEYNNQDSPGVGGFLASIGSEETEAAGATWAEDEDTELLDAVKLTNYRLRIEVSNEGTDTTGAQTYQLEVAETGTCSGGSYSAVPTDSSGDWQISASTHLTDGSATTNVASGLTDENTTFVTGEQKDTGNTTGNITLTATQFTEIEFSVQATSNATDGGSYCFRLTNIDTYSVYAEITLEAGGATFTLNNYRFYTDNDNENVTDVWGSPDIAENTMITTLPATNDPPVATDELRLRINITVGGASLSATSQQFKLQYKAGTDATCTTGSWTDVGAGAGGSIWRFATSGVTDGTTLTVSKLTGTDVLQVYSKANPTATNPNSATAGQDIEYDFHIEHNGAADASTYSFRVVESDDTPLTAYTNCPTLETRPGTTNLLRHGAHFINESARGFIWAD